MALASAPPRSRFLGCPDTIWREGSGGALAAMCNCWQKDVRSLGALAPNTLVTWSDSARKWTISTDAATPFSLATGREAVQEVMSLHQVKLLAAARIRSIGVCYGVGRRSGPIVTKARFTTKL